MIYRYELTDILETVVNSLQFSVTIKSQVINTDGSITLSCCDIYHAEVGRIVTIGVNDYTITAIDDTVKTITVIGTGSITTTTFELYHPKFFYGTPLAMENELIEIEDAADKTPMIFLLLKYREQYFEDLEDTLDRISNCTIYFLTQSNFEDWKSTDIFTNAVKPMHRLQQNFLNFLKTDNVHFNMIDFSDNYDPETKFGVYVANKGVPKGFFTDKLSGGKTDFALPIYKDYSCDNCQ